MNQHIPGNHLNKIEILKKVCFVSGKIKVMAIYHKPFNLVKCFVKNFTISTLEVRLPNAFILYYGKAIKNESILTPPLGG
jgi:hypothetical protein